MTVLERILASKRDEVRERRARVPLEELQAAVRDAPPVRSLGASLAPEQPGLRVVAEVKKASPSKGLIRADFDPLAIARGYERAGAAAISVLTDEKYFQGSLDDLRAIRRAVSLPVLRKDFLIDPYQMWEARASGADAVLLIVAALPDTALKGLGEEAAALGMETLWEVHAREELERLRPFAPRLVGINNRDLKTFNVSLETTRRLAPEAPPGALVVSESGFSARSELEEMRGWGVHAFLIGERLMRAADPAAALGALLGRGEPS